MPTEYPERNREIEVAFSQYYGGLVWQDQHEALRYLDQFSAQPVVLGSKSMDERCTYCGEQSYINSKECPQHNEDSSYTGEPE